MWSDSEAALKMINDTTSKFKAYFSNRLSKIHAGSSPTEWRHVDSAQNPADLTSRGVKADEDDKWRFFHYGPEFLLKPESQWPKTILQRPNSAHIAAILVDSVEKEKKDSFPVIIAQKRSSWTAKCRLIAVIDKIVRRWRRKAKARTRNEKSAISAIFPLSATEIRQGELVLVRGIQEKYFSDEIDQLRKQGKSTADFNGEKRGKKLHSLRRHNPFIDDDNLLRVGSRLLNASTSTDATFPMILPPKDENTRALIRLVHIQEQHAGPKHTLCQLRQRFWINQGLQAVKSVIGQCVSCQRLFKAPASQQMAPLPAMRVRENPPFAETGLDLMGPFLCKMNGRADHKIWIAIFTCMVTRAVHSELVYKLDAASMINAISRFASRRPGVRKFTSDQGTNLVGAAKILKKEMQAWNEGVNNHLQKKGIEWNFIPAGTPHYGGVWERVVGLFKKSIKSSLNGDTLHVDVINTIVIEAESILNKRPLTALSDDPSDADALTPAHILYPATFAHSTASVFPPNPSHHAQDARNAWEKAQSRINSFWKSWSKEYLSLLHERSKWRTSKRNLAEGDLVIIVDESVHRHDWKMARILKTEGSGPHVRRVRLKRSDGKIVLKDRTKIVPLELENSNR